jgi:hypothetical protein
MAANDRPPYLDDGSVGFAGFARMKQEQRVSLAEPVHARDVPRAPASA